MDLIPGFRISNRNFNMRNNNSSFSIKYVTETGFCVLYLYFIALKIFFLQRIMLVLYTINKENCYLYKARVILSDATHKTLKILREC